MKDNKLQDFALTLMNHVRNDARTSIDAVESSHAAWVRQQESKEQSIQNKTDEYNTEHHQPRLERDTQYKEYLFNIQAIYEKYLRASTGQRRTILKEYIRARANLPEPLKDGLMTDLIYTTSR